MSLPPTGGLEPSLVQLPFLQEESQGNKLHDNSQRQENDGPDPQISEFLRDFKCHHLGRSRARRIAKIDYPRKCHPCRLFQNIGQVRVRRGHGRRRRLRRRRRLQRWRGLRRPSGRRGRRRLRHRSGRRGRRRLRHRSGRRGRRRLRYRSGRRGRRRLRRTGVGCGVGSGVGVGVGVGSGVGSGSGGVLTVTCCWLCLESRGVTDDLSCRAALLPTA